MKESEWKEEFKSKCDAVVASYSEVNGFMDKLDNIEDVSCEDELAMYIQVQILTMQAKVKEVLS